MKTNCFLTPDVSNEKEFELVKIEKTKKVCPMCEDFAGEKIINQIPFAILSCEGACLRGEVSRRVANLICFSLLPEKTSRICLGGAFTKDSGQRNLVKNSSKVLALEGCYIECASRMMKGVIADLNPEVVIVDRLYEFDRKLFGINEATEEQIKEFTQTAAEKIAEKINLEKK